MLKPSRKNGEGLWNEGEESGYEQGAQKKKTATLKSDGLLFTMTVKLVQYVNFSKNEGRESRIIKRHQKGEAVVASPPVVRLEEEQYIF
jgi:hypothetical protein